MGDFGILHFMSLGILFGPLRLANKSVMNGDVDQWGNGTNTNTQVTPHAGDIGSNVLG